MRLKTITISIAVSLLTAACITPLNNVVITKAKTKPSTCGRPRYPRASLVANETGVVDVSLHVSKEGRVIETKIVSSSGYKRLDSTAADAMRACEFVSATENGVAVDSWVTMRWIWNTK
ncbi:energy transducer TonB [Collimonas fungivorans]|uniref:energy transducer TonB n=1 Tax=Collimonas fungivorans TaxID=158899 RepID=UPI0009ED4E96|nr:energy transducer TonB [Collimonas fungivorans]